MKPINLPEVLPRYEFRVFAENLVPVFQSLKEMAGEPHIRQSDEVYFVSEYCWDINLKIRDEKLDIKVLVHEKEGLEFWVPKEKLDFPLAKEDVLKLLRDDILFEGISPREKELSGSYSKEKFLELIKGFHEIRMVPVKKKRYGFVVKDVILEFAEAIIHGHLVHTVAVESTEPARVLEMVKALDLVRHVNTNYLVEIKRRVGMGQDEHGDHC